MRFWDILAALLATRMEDVYFMSHERVVSGRRALFRMVCHRHVLP